MKCVSVLPLNSIEAYHVTLWRRTPGASLVGGQNVQTGYRMVEEGSGTKVRRYPKLTSITYRSVMSGAPGVIPGAKGCCEGAFYQTTIS